MVDEIHDESNKETVDMPYIEKEIVPEPKKRSLMPLWILIGCIIVAGVVVWYQFFRTKAPAPPVVQKKETVAQKPVPKPEPVDTTVLTEGQQKFNEIFTESLLKESLGNAGKGFDLAMFRNMIRIAMNAQFLSDRPGMTWDKWQRERAKVQKMARKELSDPAFLKWLWKRYSPIVVTVIKASGKSALVKKLCAKAEPYFSGELPHRRFVQLDDYYKTDTKLEREIQKRKYSKDAIHSLTEKLDKKYRVLRTAGLDDTDVYFFEFSMRRIKEGGRELAQAYGDILNDLKNRI